MKLITFFLTVLNYNLLLPYLSNNGSPASSSFFVQAKVEWIDTLKAQVKDVSNALDKFVNVNLGVEHMQVSFTGVDLRNTAQQYGGERTFLYKKAMYIL